jgi:hypothetical protein
LHFIILYFLICYQFLGSATSLEESRESTPSAGTTSKKYESDIEVLSNPSQSSIEVLDDGSKYVIPSVFISSDRQNFFNFSIT